MPPYVSIEAGKEEESKVIPPKILGRFPQVEPPRVARAPSPAKCGAGFWVAQRFQRCD
jgi:hypothetical protein